MRFGKSSPNVASRSRAWQQVALFIVTLAVFLRAGQCGFVNYDDPQYVYENPHVKTGLSYLNLIWAFSALHGDVSYWHPLTWVSHQLDSQLFGLNPGPHHLTSVWIHVANTLLLFAVLARLGLPSPVSFLTAGLFARTHCTWNPSPGFPSVKTFFAVSFGSPRC